METTIPVWSVSCYRRRRAAPRCRKKFQAPVDRGGGWFRGSYNQQQAMEDYSSVASVSTRTGGGNTSVSENWEDIEGEYRREGVEADAFIEESADSKSRVNQFRGFRVQHIKSRSVEHENSDLEEENKELNWQLKKLYRKYTNDS